MHGDCCFRAMTESSRSCSRDVEQDVVRENTLATTPSPLPSGGGVKPIALHMLGKRSITELHPQSIVTFFFFFSTRV
jgi:hypothetical protein